MPAQNAILDRSRRGVLYEVEKCLDGHGRSDAGQRRGFGPARNADAERVCKSRDVRVSRSSTAAAPPRAADPAVRSFAAFLHSEPTVLESVFFSGTGRTAGGRAVPGVAGVVAPVWAAVG